MPFEALFLLIALWIYLYAVAQLFHLKLRHIKGSTGVSPLKSRMYQRGTGPRSCLGIFGCGILKAHMAKFSVAQDGAVSTGWQSQTPSDNRLRFNASLTRLPEWRRLVADGQKEEANRSLNGPMWTDPPTGGQNHALSSEHISMLRDARQFIEQRYRDLGLELPTCTVRTLVRQATQEMFSEAEANALARRCAISMASDGHRDELVSLIVHEYSHALGLVSISKEISAKHYEHSLWHTGISWSRSGALMQTQGSKSKPPRALFRVFDEGAAVSHENAYYTSRGWVERSSTRTFSLTPDVELNTHVLRALLVQYYPEQYKLISSTVRDDDWRGAINKYLRSEPRSLELKIPVVYRVSTNGRNTASAYSTMMHSLDLLARELYPSCQASIASRKFRDELCRIQAGESYAPLLKLMTHTFGVDGVKFISALQVDTRMKEHTEDELALLVFAEAGSLPQEIKAEVRQLAIDAVLAPRPPDFVAALTPFLQHIESDLRFNQKVYYNASDIRVAVARAQATHVIDLLCDRGDLELALRFKAAFAIPSNALSQTSQQSLAGKVPRSAPSPIYLSEHDIAAQTLTALFQSRKPLAQGIAALPKGFTWDTKLRKLAIAYFAALDLLQDSQLITRTRNALRLAGVPVDEFITSPNESGGNGKNRTSKTPRRK